MLIAGYYVYSYEGVNFLYDGPGTLRKNLAWVMETRVSLRATEKLS